jgi:hypothetical protein
MRGDFSPQRYRRTIDQGGTPALPGENISKIIQRAKPRKIIHFCLAKGWVMPSLPLPCQESLEKQRHGKPLPSVSKSLEQGRSYVVNKAHATCCKARTASGNAGWAKRASCPMLTLETSGKIFLSPVDSNRRNCKRPRPRIGRPSHSLIPQGRHEQVRLWKE